MPIYEYECAKCGERIEVNQKISDKPLKKHNHQSDCGGELTKLISANSFMLKGSGWFKDGYSSKAPVSKSSANETAPTPCSGGACRGGGCSND